MKQNHIIRECECLGLPVTYAGNQAFEAIGDFAKVYWRLGHLPRVSSAQGDVCARSLKDITQLVVNARWAN